MTHNRFYIFIFIGFLTVAGAASFVGWKVVFKKVHTPLAQMTVAELSQRCDASAAQENMGAAEISQPTIISGEDSAITTDCVVRIVSGGSLKMTDTAIDSAHLFITSDNAAPAAVTFERVTMRGADAGLQISLPGEGSTLTVHDSTFDYDASIGLSVGAGDHDTQSQLRVSNSVFISDYEDTEGITLVSTGLAEVVNNHFTVGGSEPLAFLLATTCQAHNNIGVNTECQAE